MNRCWTRVGYKGFQGNRHVVNLERPGCIHRATIIHELLHVLGFYHEHERHDRDDHILVNVKDLGISFK